MPKRTGRPRKQRTVYLTDIEWAFIDKLVARGNSPNQNGVISAFLANHAFWQQFLEMYAPAQDLFEDYYKRFIEDGKLDNKVLREGQDLQDLTIEQLIKWAYPTLSPHVDNSVESITAFNAVREHSEAYIEENMSPLRKAYLEAVREVISDETLDSDERAERANKLFLEYEKEWKKQNGGSR